MIGSMGGLFLAATGSGHGFEDPVNRILVISTIIVVVAVILVAMLARKGTGLEPSGMGAVFEHIYDWIDDLAQGMMGREGRRYVPFAMSIFLFVLASNWSGLLPMPKFGHAPAAAHGEAAGHGAEAEQSGPGAEAMAHTPEAAVESEGASHEEAHPPFEAPSVSFNTTLALAMVSFLAFNFYGIRKNLEGPSHGGDVHTGSPVDPHLATDHGHGEGDSAHGHHHHHEHKSGGGIGGLFTWVAHFWQPTPMLWRDLEGPMRYLLVPLLACLFIVLNIVEEVARLVSLSIRLYGNIFGEHQVKGKLTETMQTFLDQSGASFQAGGIGGGLGFGMMAVLLWVSSFFVMCIGTLAGFIQAFIFFVLTLSYIAHAVAEEH